MKEIRKIDNMKVRALCIKDNYYTRGTNEAYNNLLFNLCNKENATLKDIQIIAEDILSHSDWVSMLVVYSCGRDDLVRMLMQNLINECCITFVM